MQEAIGTPQPPGGAPAIPPPDDAGAPAGATPAPAATQGGTAPPDAPAGPGDSAIAGVRAEVEAAAAVELARVYRALPGVVAELIGGTTIADVQAAYVAAQRVYADVRAAVLRDLGAALPPGHAAPGAPPAPADPFGLIAAGLRK